MSKLIRVGDELHKETKVAATLEGKTIRDYTEAALRAKLNGDKRTTDSRVCYETEAS